MQFRILGPLEVVDEGKALPIGEGRKLALLALLLLRKNEVVSTQMLVDELWSERPPATAEKMIRNYVSLLRKQLGDRLVRRRPGYLLRVEAGELDSERLETLVREAREQPPEVASATLRQAVALWSGPPLAQLAYEPFAQREIGRLEELRLQALEGRIDADLELGRDRELVPELEQLVRDHPLRERVRGLLMLALYRAGRQADALDVYQDARRTLVDGLGLEPSPELQELQRQILAHDEALAGSSRRMRPIRRRRHGALMIATAGVVLLATAIAAGFEFTSNSARLTSIASNSVGVIDPKSNRIVADIPIGSAPAAITFGNGALWTANPADDTVSRIDPKTRTLVKTIAVPGAPSSLVVFGRNLWVLLDSRSGSGPDAREHAEIARIDTSVNDVFGSYPLSAKFGNGSDTIGAGDGALWAADHGVISRFDPVGRKVTAKIQIENWYEPRLTVGDGSVWALGPGTVERIDPTSTSLSALIQITNGTGPIPTAVALGAGAIWIANRTLPTPKAPSAPSTVSRINTSTNAVMTTITAGQNSDAIAVGADAIWVANHDDGTLTRIDPKTNTPVAITTGSQPTGLTVAAGYVWVTAD
jgi:YVTN family beta-propeller protein